jgi:hypothetical protein
VEGERCYCRAKLRRCSAGLPFTVKSLPGQLPYSPGRSRLIMKSPAAVLMVTVAGRSSGGHCKTHQFPVGVGVLLRCAVNGVTSVTHEVGAW